jgi:hypothetical protein
VVSDKKIFKISANENTLWTLAAMLGFAKMNRNLVGSTYGRFYIKFPQSRMKGERYRLSSLLSL